jgi:uncharacterized protein YndB with AHSA1/START domain
MAKTEIVANPGSPQVLIIREFDAPAELLFRAHVEPDLVKQWLGPGKYEMVIDRYEVRDGGRWRFVHRDTDGNEFGFHGVFHGNPSVETGIVQTWEFEGAPGHVSLQTATFERRDGKTVVRDNAVFQSVEARDANVQAGMAEGVYEGHERLDALLAQLAKAG